MPQFSFKSKKFNMYVSVHDPAHSSNHLCNPTSFSKKKIYSSLLLLLLFIPHQRVDISVYLAFLCLNRVEQGSMRLASGLTEPLQLFCYL